MQVLARIHTYVSSLCLSRHRCNCSTVSTQRPSLKTMCLLGSGWILYLFTLASTSVLAGPTNRTIDDQKGDSVTGRLPLYTPADGWNLGPQCVADARPLACHVHLDPSQCFGGTWHDGTSDPLTRSVTAFFTGTAVYVYGILANTVNFTNTVTNLTFQLDDAQVGTFLHVPTNSTDYQYNALFYANDTIPNGDHMIIIQTNGDNGFFLTLFDYIIYTFVDGEPNRPEQHNSTTTFVSTVSAITAAPSVGVSLESYLSPGHHAWAGAIAGGVVGGLAFLVFLVLMIRRCIRRRHRALMLKVKLMSSLFVSLLSTASSQPEPFTEVRIRNSRRSSFTCAASPSVGSKRGTDVFRQSANPTRSSRGTFTVEPFPPEIAPPPPQSIKRSLIREARPAPSASSSNITALVSHVAALRNDVARLREKGGSEKHLTQSHPVPPQYHSSPPAR